MRRMQNEPGRRGSRTTWKSSLQGQEATHRGVFRRAGLNGEEAACPAVDPCPEPMEGRNGTAIRGMRPAQRGGEGGIDLGRGGGMVKKDFGRLGCPRWRGLRVPVGGITLGTCWIIPA